MLTDIEIREKAMKRANSMKKVFAKKFTDPSIYPPEEHPVSVYMAGSPGAGKTEASKQLLQVARLNEGKNIRIDPDELRSQFEGYNGANAHLFQGAVSTLVSRIIDLLLKQSQSFLLDGTLATDYHTARDNIQRSVKRDRLVQIYYVYQEPLLAWDFVKAREYLEGRKIGRDSFIQQYFAARKNVTRLKKHFKDKIKVDLLLKNYDGSARFYYINVNDVDSHIPEKYTETSIEEIIPMD